MEMLMARAEAERGALERELRAMRCTASEAASHLHLAEEGLRVCHRCPAAAWPLPCHLGHTDGCLPWTSGQQNWRCCYRLQTCCYRMQLRQA